LFRGCPQSLIDSFLLECRKVAASQDEFYDLKNSLESQIGILSWCFERCLALPRVSVIRYEDIIAGGGAALAPLAPLASNLSEKFLSRDSSNFEIAPLFQELGEKLLRSNGAFWEFYSKESVEALLSRHTQVAS
jgi:hypothetical protein